MNQFLHNLSMQVLSRSCNLIQLEFAGINHLNQEINRLIHSKLSYFTEKQFNLPACYEPAVADIGDEQTSNKKIEDAIVSEILNHETLDVEEGDNDDNISETAAEAAELKKNQRDLEVVDNLADARERKFLEHSTTTITRTVSITLET